MLKYSVDTSAILDAWVRYYPIDLFPTFWDRFSGLCSSGVAGAVELVGHELDKKDDGCRKWFNKNGLHGFFLPLTDPIQFKTIELLHNPTYQRLIEDRKGVYAADPFIIAHAQVHELTLVTGERPNGSMKKPRIPDVCSELTIPWINIQELMRKEGWSF